MSRKHNPLNGTEPNHISRNHSTSDKSKAHAEKSLFITYLLWLVGGIFGVHHFYLGRDIQGFLWWCTLGGYFGFGWLRDIFHIQNYVADANKDRDYLDKFNQNLRSYKYPPFSTIRFTGMTVVAYLWSTVVSMAIPEDDIAGLPWKYLHFLVPLAGALGVWSVGNIGHETGTIWWCLAGAYACYPLFWHMDESTACTVMTLVSALAFDTLSKRWQTKPKPRKRFLKRCLTIGACALLYSSLWGSYLYFNAKITDGEGEEIPLNEAMHHFFKSPWWVDLKQSLVDTWDFAQQHGWYETWSQIVELSDPFGEQNAFKVLGLSHGARQSEINSACRLLSVKYHPDKARGDQEKLQAQSKFYEIQQACELLSNKHAKRRQKNKRSQ